MLVSVRLHGPDQPVPDAQPPVALSHSGSLEFSLSGEIVLSRTAVRILLSGFRRNVEYEVAKQVISSFRREKLSALSQLQCIPKALLAPGFREGSRLDGCNLCKVLFPARKNFHSLL